MDRISYIKEQFLKLNLELSQTQAEQFQRYAELLVEWNSFMNLTAITEFEEIVEKHFIDSVALVLMENVSRETSEETVIDVGTGAGFPGIPLKIVFPQWKVTLLDSLNKRVKFLDTVISELDLTNITAVHGRAEETAQNQAYREKYTLCISRAVANLATLSEYCLPFIALNGRFISYKSGEVEEELKSAEKAIQILGGKIVKKVPFVLPGTDIHRSFIEIQKIKATPKKYPRKAGTPNRQPLS